MPTGVVNLETISSSFTPTLPCRVVNPLQEERRNQSDHQEIMLASHHNPKRLKFEHVFAHVCVLSLKRRVNLLCMMSNARLDTYSVRVEDMKNVPALLACVASFSVESIKASAKRAPPQTSCG